MPDQVFLQSLLAGITQHPGQLRLKRTEDMRGILFRVHAARTDMPLIIGRDGKSIAALRLIMKLYAKGGTPISVILEEPQHSGGLSS